MNYKPFCTRPMGHLYYMKMRKLCLVICVCLVMLGSALSADDDLLRLLRTLENEVSATSAESSKAPAQTVLQTQKLQGSPLKIAAFNIQVFGVSKYNDQEVKEHLLPILARYDIVLVQEIRESDSEKASINKLLDDLNRYVAYKGIEAEYDMVISGRLGDSNSKEQYAYIYNTKIGCKVESTWQHPDEIYFERDPFCVVFECPNSAVGRFGLMGIHTQPSAAPEEINKLADAYDRFSQAKNIEDVIIMGDFNAGCTYVTKSEWEDIALRTQDRFQWLLGDDIDTTVKASSCPYDRFVVAGKRLQMSVIPNSVKVYNFEKEMGISYELAKDMSDHYPIELEIYAKVSDEVTKNVGVENSFSVEGELPELDMDAVKKSLDKKVNFRSFKEPYQRKPSLIVVELSSTNDVISEITTFTELTGAPVSDYALVMVESYLTDAGALKTVPRVPGFVDPLSQKMNVRLVWETTKDAEGNKHYFSRITVYKNGV